MSKSVPTVVIVGAGTAGCTVAKTLAEAFLSTSHDANIVVVERGGENPHHNDKNFMRSIEKSSPAVTSVPAHLSSDVPRDMYDYVQGRCIGGGGSVNAMVVTPIRSTDFQRWEDAYGCNTWGNCLDFHDLNQLMPTTTITKSDMGEVGSTLITVGGSPATLTWRRDQRFSGETMITPLIDASRLQLRTGTAESLVVEDGHVRGVVVDSELVSGDVVILASGAVMTPLLLQESGIHHAQLGRNAQDHPALFFTIPRVGKTLPSDFENRFVATASLSEDDTQVIAYEVANSTAPEFGLLSLSLLHVESRGHVAGTATHPELHLNLLHSHEDRARMRHAVRHFLSTKYPTFTQQFGAVLCDDKGTDAQMLSGLSDGALDDWMLNHVVPHSHISGTCAMGGKASGAPVSPRGQIAGVHGLYVADASIFPVIPRCNTNMVTAIVASQIGRFIVEDMA